MVSGPGADNLGIVGPHRVVLTPPPFGDVSFISSHSSERTTINGEANADVDANPTAGDSSNP